MSHGAGNMCVNNCSITPTPPHTGYTRRAKLGDSRSTGRLHASSTTQRSLTRLNVAGGSVGGLHKSMTKLSSSQQINQHGNGCNIGSTSGIGGGNGGTHSQNLNFSSNASVSNANVQLSNNNYSTQVPPLGNNVIVTGNHKYLFIIQIIGVFMLALINFRSYILN